MKPHTHGNSPQDFIATLGTRKKLFVLCDGTWQDGINNKSPLTNVATLARCLKPIDSDGCPQTVYYDNGVGNVTSTPAQVIDGMTGRGISAKIRNAYSFLAHNYNFREKRDEIILIGFSRGAFAVQCLASLISQTGLLEKQYLYYLRGLFTLWANQKVKGGDDRLINEVQRLENLRLLHKVEITACAVWDTVSALGIPTQLPPRPLSFVGKQVPNRVRHAFQALALDEKRPKFKPCVWESKEPIEPKEPRGPEESGKQDNRLHDRVGVQFIENEIAKHLKHKYLEWDFVVNKTFGSFTETRILSTMPHSGQATKSNWWWFFLGQKPRADSLRSTASNQPLSVPMEIHFTVRFTMASHRNSCSTLNSWRTVRVLNKVQWKSENGRQTLDEHSLGKSTEEDMEHHLLRRWCNPGLFQPLHTERSDFAAIKDPGSEEGLEAFALFLKEYIDGPNGDDLARTRMYPSTG